MKQLAVHYRFLILLLCVLHSSRIFAALNADQLLLIVNQNSPEGVKLAAYYAKARGVPVDQIIALDCPAAETIDCLTYEKQIAAPVRNFLKQKQLDEKIKCLVTFYGVPLRTSPRKLTDAESGELVDLQAQRKQLLTSFAQATGQIEAVARKVVPNYAAPVGGDRYNELRQRLGAAAGAINSALPGISDPSLRTQVEADAQALEKLLSTPVADTITTQPSTLPTDFNSDAIAADPRKIDELTTSNFDAESRSLLRAVIRKRGLVAYTELVENQIEYLNADNNEACVDSELSMVRYVYYPRTKWVPNPMCPSNRISNGPAILMTARLDAPSPENVQRMIDESIKAEKDGLKGKVVIDSRGIPARKPDGSNDGYGQTDEQLRALTRVLRSRTQLAIIADDMPNVILPKAVSDVAIYVGWYSPGVYIQSVGKFVPGAVGYHIASYEMQSMHDPNYKGWVPNLLRDGIDATLGPTYEPYLAAFPRPDDFVMLLLTGKMTLAEVYWHTAALCSWQVGLVGDPLYTPFKTNPSLKKEDLARWLQPLLDESPAAGK